MKLISLIALVLLTASCAGSGPAALDRTPPATASASPSPTGCATDSQGDNPQRPTTMPSTPETSATTTGTEPLNDGMYIAFLSAIDVPARTVRADVAQWFSGEAANKAAAEDGEIEKGDSVPNDYWIRNQSKYERDVPLACPVTVTVININASTLQQTGSLVGLATSLRSNENFDLGTPYRGRQSTYWLTVENGEVTRIDEQYRP